MQSRGPVHNPENSPPKSRQCGHSSGQWSAVVMATREIEATDVSVVFTVNWREILQVLCVCTDVVCTFATFKKHDEVM